MVIRSYCLAVRSALTDDGHPELPASGLTLHERLTLIATSLERVAKKGASQENLNGAPLVENRRHLALSYEVPSERLLLSPANELGLVCGAMRLFVACWTEYNKMLRIVTIEQIAGEMDRMQLQSIIVLTAFRANRLSLLTQRAFQVIHLSGVDQVQADVKKETGKD
jgi:hypothetical protein